MGLGDLFDSTKRHISQSFDFIPSQLQLEEMWPYAVAGFILLVGVIILFPRR